MIVWRATRLKQAVSKVRIAQVRMWRHDSDKGGSNPHFTVSIPPVYPREPATDASKGAETFCKCVSGWGLGVATERWPYKASRQQKLHPHTIPHKQFLNLSIHIIHDNPGRRWNAGC